MKTQILISAENRLQLTDILSKILADEFILYTKTRNAHWNVEGPDFYDKHIFFETQYGELAELIDTIAERIRTLGHYAPASLKKFLQLTHLTEESRLPNDAQSFIKILLSDHEHIIGYLRENIDLIAEELKDLGSSDFITGLLTKHEKMAWMLRSHIS